MSAVTVTVRRSFWFNGQPQAVGSVLTVSRTFAAELIANGKAAAVSDEQPASTGSMTTENTPQVVVGAPARARRKETEK